jgi:hypothetical protein
MKGERVSPKDDVAKGHHIEYLHETSSRKFSVRQQHNGGPQLTKVLRRFAPTSLRLDGNSAPRSRGGFLSSYKPGL